VKSFSKAVIRWGCLYDKALKSSDINKSEFIKIVNRFWLLEQEMPRMTVVYNRDPVTNGLFLKCDDIYGRSVPSAIQDLLNDRAMMLSNPHVQAVTKVCCGCPIPFASKQVCQ
jgi:hypothetical protein